jgi:hypothetical protein
MTRFPHFLHSRLTDGIEVVCHAYWLGALYPPQDSWYSFLVEAESTSGIVQLEEIGQLKHPMTSSGIKPTTF